ncbi:tRNA (adenine(58)-N(1))-methyltransferase [hydrothermal vent metagenome]|uniref:tRNA (Adenine(58)-N(1))-methyltransferase n=1 Tax=hydrothermal vent metagenome TaxID=652676 RepID=A0A3B0RVN7_9ZZZZ
MTTGDPFRQGDLCLLNDAKGRQYLVTLASGSTWQSDKGSLAHDVVIGEPEGATVATSTDTPLVALRPRLADYVLRMKRGAAVMYPKDTGALIMWADIAPGCTVVEAGTGSGALTLALLRAVGDRGVVVSVERRQDHAVHAGRLIEAFLGEIPTNLDLRIGDVEDVIGDVAPDRIVLDLPEPWHSVAAAVESLAGGGVLASYLPTVPQVQTLREELHEAKIFTEVDTFEILMRSWTVEGRSVRPDHRMVGHTGFITVARKRLRRTR